MGNTHPGGDRGGLFKVVKFLIPDLLSKADSPPTASGMSWAIRSFLVFIFMAIPPKTVYEGLIYKLMLAQKINLGYNQEKRGGCQNEI